MGRIRYLYSALWVGYYTNVVPYGLGTIEALFSIGKLLSLLTQKFALQYLHSRSIVHRDLKPDNSKYRGTRFMLIICNVIKPTSSFLFLVASKVSWHLKVSDFGLAKNKDKSQALKSWCGTSIYSKSIQNQFNI